MRRAWMLVLFAGDGTSMYAAAEGVRAYTPFIGLARTFPTPHDATLTLVTDYRDYCIPGRFAIVRVEKLERPEAWEPMVPASTVRIVTGSGVHVHLLPNETLEVLTPASYEWREVPAE